MAIGTTAALAIGLGAAGVGSALSASSASKAASKAADTSVQTAAMNNALARDIYGQNQATLAPYVQAGRDPSKIIANALGYGNEGHFGAGFSQYLRGSDYGFQLQEGGNALNSGYAGAGTLQSGAAMKGMERFRQNLQTGYRNEYMNALTGQQAVGLNAAGAQAGVASNYSANVQNNNNAAGSAVANAALIRGQNNPLGNALGVIGGGMMQWGLGK